MDREVFGLFDTIKYAFNTLRAHWKQLFLIYFAVMTPIAGPAALFSAINGDAQPVGVVQSCMAACAVLVFFLVALWGVAVCARVSLYLYDGKSFGFDDVVSSTRYMLPILGTWGFVLLYGLGISGIFAVAAAYKIVFLLPLGALGIAVGFWLLVRTVLSTFFIVDKEYGAKQALVSSYKATRGKFWLLVVIKIVATTITPFVCIVPLFLVVSLVHAISPVIAYPFALVAGSLYQAIVGWMFWLSYGYVYRKLTLTESHVQQEQPGLSNDLYGNK